MNDEHESSPFSEGRPQPTNPVTEKESDRMKRLLDAFLNQDEEDSEFVLVSSTKQRFELLSAIDKEIITITSGSKLPKRAPTPFSVPGTFVVVAVILLSCILFRCLCSNRRPCKLKSETGKRKAKKSVDSQPPKKLRENNSMDESLFTASSPATASPNSSLTVQVQSTTTRVDLYSESLNDSELPKLVTEPIVSSSSRQLSTNITASKESLQVRGGDMLMDSSTVSLSSGDLMRRSSSNMVEQMANQIAQHIKVCEEALRRNGVDPSHAPHVAVTLQSMEFEERRIWLEASRIKLHRQLSERQHGENLQATKYDPNWREKLHAARDKCWNAVTRLFVELGIAYQFARMLRPLIDVYRLGSLVSTTQILQMIAGTVSKTCGILRFFFLGSPLTHYLLSFQCSQACDCSEHGATAGMLITSLVIPSGSSAWRWMGLDAYVDSGLCYGQCILSYGIILTAALVLHQMLRIVSAPASIHNAVNIASMLIFYLQSNIVGLTSWNFVLLCGSMASLVAVVQSKTNQQRKVLSNIPVDKFYDTFEACSSHMEDLHTGLCLFRYFIVGMYVASSLANHGVPISGPPVM
jgi:hypothetical protein